LSSLATYLLTKAVKDRQQQEKSSWRLKYVSVCYAKALSSA
jgi:hypothetical protein